MHKVNYHYYFNFPGLVFVQLYESVKGLPYQGGGDSRILKIACVLENYTGTDDWQCRYIRDRCSLLAYVVLSKAENKVLYGKYFGTTERITQYPRSLTNCDRFKTIQVCFECATTFEILEATVVSRQCIRVGVKSRQVCGTACTSDTKSFVLPIAIRNVKIKIDKSIISPAVLYPFQCRV